MPSLAINVDVDNLDRATSFYTRAFELRVGKRLGDDAVELLGADVPIHLLQKSSGSTPFSGAITMRTYARHWTPVHLDFTVPDLDAAHRRVEEAGARREGKIETHAWGRIAFYSDPFGHGFCLLQMNDRS